MKSCITWLGHCIRKAILYNRHLLIAWPFLRLSGLSGVLGRFADFSRAQTLFSSLCPSSPISSVSLDTNGEKVGPPADQSNWALGWPPFSRMENTPTPSLLQQTEIDGGMVGEAKANGRKSSNVEPESGLFATFTQQVFMLMLLIKTYRNEISV